MYPVFHSHNTPPKRGTQAPAKTIDIPKEDQKTKEIVRTEFRRFSIAATQKAEQDVLRRSDSGISASSIEAKKVEGKRQIEEVDYIARKQEKRALDLARKTSKQAQDSKVKTSRDAKYSEMLEFDRFKIPSEDEVEYTSDYDNEGVFDSDDFASYDSLLDCPDTYTLRNGEEIELDFQTLCRMLNCEQTFKDMHDVTFRLEYLPKNYNVKLMKNLARLYSNSDNVFSLISAGIRGLFGTDIQRRARELFSIETEKGSPFVSEKPCPKFTNKYTRFIRHLNRTSNKMAIKSVAIGERRSGLAYFDYFDGVAYKVSFSRDGLWLMEYADSPVRTVKFDVISKELDLKESESVEWDLIDEVGHLFEQRYYGMKI